MLVPRKVLIESHSKTFVDLLDFPLFNRSIDPHDFVACFDGEGDRLRWKMVTVRFCGFSMGSKPVGIHVRFFHVKNDDRLRFHFGMMKSEISTGPRLSRYTFLALCQHFEVWTFLVKL